MGLDLVGVRMLASQWGEKGPRPGHYTGEGVIGESIPILCPLCEGMFLKMIQLAPGARMTRLVEVNNIRPDGIVYGRGVIVPETHQVVGCGVCHVAFTILKEAIP